MLPISVGLGLVVSLLFTETLGPAAGGMIVPGYIALVLTRPTDVLLTMVAGLLTFAVVRALSAVAIVFGRRRTVLMILVGFLAGLLVEWLSQGALGRVEAGVVGYIIPGLIGLWLDRQGIVDTLLALVTASAMVRLLLVVFAGLELGT
ncbi:MAG: poly-gamma-glutamate biosynthesis protein PgsC [Deltaproteobacteria bacterium]|nr:poly-gamma-glutamate biosynthesis protein PgsC [Deltaproteobacteria bacterium]